MTAPLRLDWAFACEHVQVGNDDYIDTITGILRPVSGIIVTDDYPLLFQPWFACRIVDATPGAHCAIVRVGAAEQDPVATERRFEVEQDGCPFDLAIQTTGLELPGPVVVHVSAEIDGQSVFLVTVEFLTEEEESRRLGPAGPLARQMRRLKTASPTHYNEIVSLIDRMAKGEHSGAADLMAELSRIRGGPVGIPRELLKPDPPPDDRDDD